MPPCKFLTADGISMASDTCLTTQDIATLDSNVEAEAKQEYLSPISIGNLEAIEIASSATEFSAMSNAEFQKPARIIYGNEIIENYPDEFTDKSNIELLDERGTQKDTEKNDSLAKSTLNMDHVYEEISVIKEPNIFEYDIMDYYEKYSPTTAKTLIDTLFLPRHKICRQCANLEDSPVYSDCLIYARKTINAREVNLCLQDDALLFKYCPGEGVSSATLYLQYDNIQPCMLVYNYLKTNASSIFYYHGPPQDIFDLKSTLKPEMILVSTDSRGLANTELYHRCVNNLYTRISSSGNSPMSFQVNHGNILSTIKHVGYDTDLQNWMNYRNDVFRTRRLKQDDVIDHRANRSSLLLLEPLLLMPELTSPRYRHGKNRISHSEHKKIVKIVIAYTLSFFILAIITFYIVYFT